MSCVTWMLTEFLYFYLLNPLMGTLKPQNNGPLYSNTVIGTLAVDGWAVTFGTARRGYFEEVLCNRQLLMPSD